MPRRHDASSSVKIDSSTRRPAIQKLIRRWIAATCNGRRKSAGYILDNGTTHVERMFFFLFFSSVLCSSLFFFFFDTCRRVVILPDWSIFFSNPDLLLFVFFFFCLMENSECLENCEWNLLYAISGKMEKFINLYIRGEREEDYLVCFVDSLKFEIFIIKIELSARLICREYFQKRDAKRWKVIFHGISMQILSSIRIFDFVFNVFFFIYHLSIRNQYPYPSAFEFVKRFINTELLPDYW